MWGDGSHHHSCQLGCNSIHGMGGGPSQGDVLASCTWWHKFKWSHCQAYLQNRNLWLFFKRIAGIPSAVAADGIHFLRFDWERENCASVPCEYSEYVFTIKTVPKSLLAVKQKINKVWTVVESWSFCYASAPWNLNLKLALFAFCR